MGCCGSRAKRADDGSVEVEVDGEKRKDRKFRPKLNKE
jgi:hypothetical protein